MNVRLVFGCFFVCLSAYLSGLYHLPFSSLADGTLTKVGRAEAKGRKGRTFWRWDLRYEYVVEGKHFIGVSPYSSGAVALDQMEFNKLHTGMKLRIWYSRIDPEVSWLYWGDASGVLGFAGPTIVHFVIGIVLLLSCLPVFDRKVRRQR